MNKIAIIEDDIDICNMIAKFLENNKYIVHYALNGAEGIHYFFNDTDTLCTFRPVLLTFCMDGCSR